MILKNFTYILGILGLFSLTLFTSCSDEENMMIVEKNWENYQNKCVNDVIALSGKGGEYNSLFLPDGVGTIYYKKSEKINSSKSISKDFRIFPSDSVSIRYIGWYKQLDGSDFIFDSTELDEKPEAKSFKVDDLVIGLSVLIQAEDMSQEWEVCIPAKIGYGEAGLGKIPGHTTLWYNIKVESVFN